MNSQYFTASEFDCPSFPGSGIHMDSDFIKILDHIREEMNEPIRITSGFRTKEHNDHLRESGYAAAETSEHLQGCACDVAVKSSGYRKRLIEAALKHGITRIGVARTFVHLDTGDKHGRKAGHVLWTY